MSHWLLVAATLILGSLTAHAQCPNGTPPPCRSASTQAPLAGWYSNLAHQLRFGGVMTLREGERAPAGARALVRLLVYAAVLLERLAPRLDRLDGRRALPVGWLARATRAEDG
jgi:hypothetical protein